MKYYFGLEYTRPIFAGKRIISENGVITKISLDGKLHDKCIVNGEEKTIPCNVVTCDVFNLMDGDVAEFEPTNQQ
jgi:hypothetical protein